MEHRLRRPAPPEPMGPRIPAYRELYSLPHSPPACAGHGRVPSACAGKSRETQNPLSETMRESDFLRIRPRRLRAAADACRPGVLLRRVSRPWRRTGRLAVAARADIPAVGPATGMASECLAIEFPIDSYRLAWPPHAGGLSGGSAASLQNQIVLTRNFGGPSIATVGEYNFSSLDRL